MNRFLHNRQRNSNSGTILFCKKAKRDSITNSFSFNEEPTNDIESSTYKLFLLSDKCQFPFFEVIPKQFTISTKNGESHFNLEMLKETSSVISDHIRDNPNEMTYFLNISDEENVLGKFEQLYQGKTVIFDEDELPISHRITKILQISNCPNFMKPESLRVLDEFDSNGKADTFNPDINSCVTIYQKWFISYLQREELQTFTITTKRKEYKCNMFGIYASQIISEIHEKDSTTNNYFYDFEDEFNEFQLICDLMNFKQVDITNDNMDILKEMSESLQITYIMKQVDDFINNYESFTQKIDEQQTIIDSIDNLFDLLYNINNYGIQKVKFSIVQSQWSQTEENVQELAAFILQVIKTNSFLHKEIVELLIQLNEEANEEANKLKILLPFIVDKLMTQYMRNPFKSHFSIIDYVGKVHEFPTIDESINAGAKFVFFFIFLLYKKGIISKEEIIEKLKNYECKNRNLNAFFLPEILEIKPKSINIMRNPSDNNFNTLDQNNDNFAMIVNKYWPDKMDLYKEMLDNLEPDDELTKSLRYDDVDKLQMIITTNRINISKAVVPYNIFDDFNEDINVINYAAYYGSLKCFKYLLLNDGCIDESTLYFAVYGGNVEIIKIVDQRIPKHDFETKASEKHYNNPNKKFITKIINGKPICIINYTNDNVIIKSTISMHRNDLFDWLFEKRFVSKGKVGNELNDIASVSAINGNSHSLIEIVDKGCDISSQKFVCTAAQNGFCKITQLILSMINTDDKKNLLNSSCGQSIVYFGNLSIFKLLVKEMNEQTIEKVILYAISMNCHKIISYFFDNLDKIGFKIRKSFVNLALNMSITAKTNECFDYLMEKFNEISPSSFKIKMVNNMLNNACLRSNLFVVKKITEIIIKMSPNLNFTMQFIGAASVGSKDICQYFLDKKVFINYEQISLKVTKLGLIDEEIFKMIYENVSLTTKFQLLKCIDQAILKKNKKLVEFLLKEKAPCKDALIEAVSTHDLEMVDLVLKYNSEPGFINHVTKDGTAFMNAIKTGDYDIAKRLLSVPGIDLSLCNIHGENCLTLAIFFGSIDIFNAILDLIGDDIVDNPWLIADAFQKLFRKMTENDPTEVEWEMVKRLCEIKTIDPNFRVENTFFYQACLCNKIGIVESFLKLEKIDVNKYEIFSYRTPLMAAIEKGHKEIAELLIQFPKTDINAVDLYDDSAFIIAVRKNDKDIVDLLIKSERFDPIKSNFNFAFFNANAEIFEQLSSSKFIDVNFCYEILNHDNNTLLDNVVEKTALIHSVEINDIEKIDFIINHPTFDKYKSSIVEAIFEAVSKNNIVAFKKLIKLIDNDINIKNKKNLSLLYVAASKLSGAIIDELFNDSNFNPANSQIVTSFITSYCGTVIVQISNNNNNGQIVPPWQYQPPKPAFTHSKTMPHWQEQELNMDIWISQNQVKDEQTIPDANSRIEIMERILNYDKENSHLIDFNKLLSNGKTFFTIICQDYEEIGNVSDFLIDHGVDPNVCDEDGIYPLLTAIGLNSYNFVHSLIHSGKVVYSQLGNRTTYLHVAAAFADDKVLRMLLEENVFDINATDINGETPLMLACRSKNVAKITLLFDIDNIDYLHCNNDGMDALDIIKELPQNEAKEARNSKENYKQKIISIVTEQLHYSYGQKCNDTNLLNNNISFIFGDQD
ncbi:hypothetical protein M9Y10_029795 [Tritrichomonas musculus]|uniref:DUF3447 domain-containing protein n=1 Tax=Tritrichomonas musculus TaxID=1915356 RepID=A0ABR2KQ67_9EUKA